MRSLFLRLFVAFWLTTLGAIVLSQQLGSYLERHRPPEASFHEHHRQAAHALRDAQQQLLRLSPFNWESWLRGLPPELDWVVIYNDGRLVTRNNRHEELAREFSHELGPRRPFLRREAGKNRILGRQLMFPPNRPYAQLFLVLPRPNPLAVEFLHRFLWLRLLLAMLASGLVCFWLVRRYMSPIQELRHATHQLAAGHLETRLSVPERNDEIADLTTDFNTMADRLQESQNAQQQLIRDISHELRTPLARIQAALALAKRGEAPQRRLDQIEAECQQLNQMIEQLLMAPSINSLQVPLEDTVDLNALLHSLVANNQLEAQNKQVSLQLKEPPETLWLRSAMHHLYRALENILRNAIRHSPETGTVTLSMQRTEKTIVIVIDDQGPGVPDDKLKAIFDPFYRVEFARDRETGGYGLGLAIAKRAAELHGGTLCARNINGGFRVEFQLPLELLTPEQETD